MFPCTLVWDNETEKIVRFWYSDTMADTRLKEAEFRKRYKAPRYEVYSEYHGGGTSSAAYDRACGIFD